MARRNKVLKKMSGLRPGGSAAYGDSSRGMTMKPGNAVGPRRAPPAAKLSAIVPRDNCVDFANGKVLYIYSKGGTELEVPVKVIGEAKKGGRHIYHIVRGPAKHFPDGIDRWVYGCK